MKAVSLTAAAAIGCSSLIGNGLPLPAAAAQSQDAVQSASSKPVPVIVRVTGKPILTTAEGAAQGDAFLTTPEAVRMAESLKSTQGYVQDEIRRLYPELAVKYSYSVLYNGFSCELPENLIGAVEELSFVESVSRTTSHAVPQLASAAELGGYPAYYDFTGCTGEGKVIAVIDSELDVTHPMFSELADTVKVSLTEKDIEEIASGIGFNVNIDPSLATAAISCPMSWTMWMRIPTATLRSAIRTRTAITGRMYPASQPARSTGRCPQKYSSSSTRTVLSRCS